MYTGKEKKVIHLSDRDQDTASPYRDHLNAVIAFTSTLPENEPYILSPEESNLINQRLSQELDLGDTPVYMLSHRELAMGPCAVLTVCKSPSEFIEFIYNQQKLILNGPMCPSINYEKFNLEDMTTQLGKVKEVLANAKRNGLASSFALFRETTIPTILKLRNELPTGRDTAPKVISLNNVMNLRERLFAITGDPKIQEVNLLLLKNQNFGPNQVNFTVQFVDNEGLKKNISLTIFPNTGSNRGIGFNITSEFSPNFAKRISTPERVAEILNIVTESFTA